MKTHWNGALLLVGAGLLFALSNTVVQHLTMGAGVPPGAVAFWQYAIGAVGFAPWLWHRRAGFVQALGWMQLLRVGLGAVGVQFWVWGLAQVPIWQAIALIMMSPIFVTLGAWAVLGERVGPRRWAAVVLGAIGGVIVLDPLSPGFDTYAILPVLAAAFWAGSTLVTKHMTRDHSAESLTAWLLILLVPLNFLLGLKGGLAVAGSAWMWLILAGGLIALAQYALVAAYRRADAAFLQPFDHVKLLFNVGLGIAAFGFVPPGRLWLGAALIVGALLLLERE